MDVIGEHREGRGLHAEEAGEGLEAIPDPGPAMVIREARKGIGAAEEGPADDLLDAVIDAHLIGEDHLRAIPPCHGPVLTATRDVLDRVGR